MNWCVHIKLSFFKVEEFWQNGSWQGVLLLFEELLHQVYHDFL